MGWARVEDERRARALGRAAYARGRAGESRDARQEWLDAADCHEEAAAYFHDGKWMAGTLDSTANHCLTRAIEAAAEPAVSSNSLFESSERFIGEARRLRALAMERTVIARLTYQRVTARLEELAGERPLEDLDAAS